MEPIIRTEGLIRDFRSGEEIIHALKGINLSIDEGKLTILRGRSGSGKTTLINLLGALDMPTKGGIFFSGKDITKLSEGSRDELRRLEMAYVFQSVALISTMTSYENIEFGLSIAGYPRNKRKQRAEECLTMVGLHKRMKHYPGEMSGGEQQRVAIARSIAHKPKIIFADEPTAEVDTTMGLQIVNIFKTLVQEEKLTVVMTTHDPGMIELADMVYTLEDGAVIDA